MWCGILSQLSPSSSIQLNFLSIYAMFWLESEIERVQAHGVSQKQIREMLEQIEEHRNAITEAWNNHFRR